MDLVKYSFANRVVSEWNRLPNSVIEARGINAFKGKLDGPRWLHEECQGIEISKAAFFRCGAAAQGEWGGYGGDQGRTKVENLTKEYSFAL